MGTISRHKNGRFPLWPSSTQLRNAVAYILVTAIALFFLNVYTSNRTRSMIFSAQHQSLSDKAQLISTALLQLDDLSTVGVEEAIDSLDELYVTRSAITDAGGTAVFDSLEVGNAEGKLLLFPEIVSAMEGNDVFYSSYENAAITSSIAIPLYRGGQLLGVVYLMHHDTSQGALIAALELNVLRISVTLELSIILISLFFSVAFSRRLKNILHSVRRMRDGDYSHKLEVRGHDELAKLGREFNNLAERLDESEQRRRQFVSDASHELKTPLASIKLLSDSILQNEMDEQTQREFISDIGREADRLGRLSQKLLALTKLDSAIEEEREIVDAALTVRKVLRTLRPLAELRKIRVEDRLMEACFIMTVEDDLHQIVFNLVENAIKYNRDSGRVLVTLERREDDILLTVKDTGVGIPQESLGHVFDRFYRVDKARSRAAGGSGLGLSIVYDMVRRNYGDIEVTSREGLGTVFALRFPLLELSEEET